MLEFLKKNRLRISILLIVSLLIFHLTTQVEKPRNENWFSAAVQYIIFPFQTVYHHIEKNAVQTWNYYFWLVDVRKENERLKEKIKSLTRENAENREIRLAYQRLRKLLRFKQENSNKMIFADVILEIQKTFSRQLIINKGSNDKIRPNYAVVTPEGIVGKIQSVTASQSVIQLITDSRSRFSVLIQRARTKAMMRGSRSGKLSVEYIPPGLPLMENDHVVTSGLAGIFPKGLPVGKIKSINKKKFELYQSVSLTPAVNLEKVEEVAIILKNVNNIHQPLFTKLKK